MQGLLYVIEVDMPDGPTLVGPWYRDEMACRSWVRLVRKYYHGWRTRVRTFTRAEAQAIQDNGGQLAARAAGGGDE